MTYGVRTLSSVSSLGNNNQNKKKNILHILSISASVTRIRWRPVASNIRIVDVEDKHDSMIAVATASIKGASAGGSGVLSLWSFHRPYMPLSIVEGHKDGAVVDFDWLDTPNPILGKSSSLEFPNEATTSRVPGVSSHDSDSILYDSIEQRDDFNNLHTMLWQHVISVGRDGCCLIQSLVRGTLIS
jgi:WD repeat-containing protein 24